jgi:hypothetical protein
VNLPLGVGLAGAYVLMVTALGRRAAPSAPSSQRHFWFVLVPLVTVLGIAVHTPRDVWGLAHICLQPLLLIALAWIATALPRQPRRVVIGWAVLTSVDFALGVALQLGIESWQFAGLIAPHGGPGDYIHALARAAFANANDKWAFQFAYVSDRLGAPAGLVSLALAALAAAVILRVKSSKSLA